jgi:transcriptional regulator with XRE-family HTH domain
MTDNLRILRELNNYAQDYIAEVLGISQNTYSRLEKEPGRISADQARKLARLYKVSLEELLSEEKPVISFGSNKHPNTQGKFKS